METLLPINTADYIRDLATRVDEFDRISLQLLADQIDELEATHARNSKAA